MSSRKNRSSGLKICNDISDKNSNPLSGERLWAGNIHKWLTTNELNLQNNNNLNEKSIDDFRNNKIKNTDTIMIVKDNNIKGFGKFSIFNNSTKVLSFRPYISSDKLSDYENYRINIQCEGTFDNSKDSFNFFKLNIINRGGRLMKKNRKTKKRSRKI
jgi:uncharacterized Zn ribbon protein